MNQPELNMEMPPSLGATEKQNTNVVAFAFKGAEIRTTSQGGNPWFVLSDVCDALGMSNPSMVAARLESDEKQTITLSQAEGIRGNPNVTIINEPGLYSVILRSDKPEAKEFKRWVCHEVLPAIRKTGAYVTPKAEVHLMRVANQFEGAIKIANLLGFKGNYGILSASNVIQEQFGVNPVQMFRAELKSDTQKLVMSPTELGSLLEKETGEKHSGQRVNKMLVEAGMQIAVGKNWEATPKGQEWAKMMDAGKKRSSGTPIQQLKWDRSILEQLKGGVR